MSTIFILSKKMFCSHIHLLQLKVAHKHVAKSIPVPQSSTYLFFSSFDDILSKSIYISLYTWSISIKLSFSLEKNKRTAVDFNSFWS
jgi:hypothetical protein